MALSKINKSFTDEIIPRVVKMILFIDDNGVETVCGPEVPVYIDLATQKVYTTDIPQYMKDMYP